MLNKTMVDGSYGHLTSRAFRNAKIMTKQVEILPIIAWGSLFGYGVWVEPLFQCPTSILYTYYASLWQNAITWSVRSLYEAIKALEAWLKVPNARLDHKRMHNAVHIVHTYILVTNTYKYAATGGGGGAAAAATVTIHSIWSMEVIFMHLCNTNWQF